MKTMCNQCSITLRVDEYEDKKTMGGEHVTCSDCKQLLIHVTPHDNGPAKIYAGHCWEQPERLTPVLIDLMGVSGCVSDAALMQNPQRAARLLTELQNRIWCLRYGGKKRYGGGSQ
jgi:hypothetical protein